MGLDWLSSCETFGQAVPVPHLSFIRLPTQEDLLAVSHGRKIDQTQVEVLEEASESLDLLDRGVAFFQSEFGLSFQALEFLSGQSMAVSASLLADDLQGLLSFLKFLPPGPEVLQDDPKLWKQGIGLFDREVPCCHLYSSEITLLYPTQAHGLRQQESTLGKSPPQLPSSRQRSIVIMWATSCPFVEVS
jgi:hypothetical protein